MIRDTRTTIISFVRLGILLVVPAACAAAHYALANRSTRTATHFVPPATQSAVSNDAVADRASISLDDFQRVVVEQRTVIIDARHPDEYREAHIPGARNFHVEAVEKDVTILTSQIDTMTDIVVYCGSKDCSDSSRLFDIMTRLLGYMNVRLFRGSFQTWQEAGLPVRTGATP